jgi:hypothetical protein
MATFASPFFIRAELTADWKIARILALGRLLLHGLCDAINPVSNPPSIVFSSNFSYIRMTWRFL